MKKLLLLSGMFFMAIAISFASASSYKINDADLDALFTDATEVSVANLNSFDMVDVNTNPLAISGDKTAMNAFLLCWFIGYFGAHRFYMGTKTMTGVLYIITGGGCGIVVTVDWVVLLMALMDDKNIDKYIDNEKFLMWMD